MSSRATALYGRFMAGYCSNLPSSFRLVYALKKAQWQVWQLFSKLSHREVEKRIKASKGKRIGITMGISCHTCHVFSVFGLGKRFAIEPAMNSPPAKVQASHLFFYPAHQTNVRQQVREDSHRANDQERRGGGGAAREIYLSEAREARRRRGGESGRGDVRGERCTVQRPPASNQPGGVGRLPREPGRAPQTHPRGSDSPPRGRGSKTL